MIRSSKELAAELGLAQSTVSMALANSPLIGRETCERVQAAAALFNYAPNRVARAMRTGKTSVIGVIIADVRVSYFPEIVNNIEIASKNHDYRCVLCQSHGLVDTLAADIRLLCEQRVDGLIIAPADGFLESEHYKQLLESKKPFVLIDHSTKSKKANWICTDNEAVGRIATDHLLELGHRQIAFIRGVEESQASLDRLEGYKQAIRQAGLEFDPRLVVGKGYAVSDGQEAIESLLHLKLKFTGVVATSDLTAIGCCKALREHGVDIPGDVSVVGCANLDVGELVNPALTTIDQKPREVAESAVRILISRIKNSKSPSESVSITPRLITRGSSASIRLRDIQ